MTNGPPPAADIRLTGEFELLLDGRRLPIPRSAERVLAYLALADRSVARSRLAGALWLDRSERSASKSLCTALWRLHRAGVDIVTAVADRIRLHPGVVVDVKDLEELACQLIRRPNSDALVRLGLLLEAVELLPDWDDEWVVADRERFRLLRLEAMESAAAALAQHGHLGDALIAALTAVHAEPLRESARRLLIRIQMAQGNHAEAIRSYGEYAALLRAEYGVAPSASIERLIEPLRRVTAAWYRGDPAEPTAGHHAPRGGLSAAPDRRRPRRGP
jgi:DNA-binding SARP family transcriptional activator